MIVGFFLGGNNVLAAEGVCPGGGEVYFSCKTGGSKLIRLCASKVSGDVSTLTYFFGSMDSSELTQVAFSGSDFEPFRFNHYFRYGVEYFRVSFVRGGYRYEVYDDYDDRRIPKESSGVVVSSVGDLSMSVDIGCVGKAAGDLSLLSSKLRCDEDNALGCAN